MQPSDLVAYLPLDNHPEPTNGPESPSVPEMEPFPLEVFPPRIAAFIKAAAKSTQTDPAMIALPALSAMGAVIGVNHRVDLGGGYVQPPVIWTAVVSPSGSGKTPAMKAALDPVSKMNREIHAENAQDRARYEIDLQNWNDLPKNEKGDRPQPPAPQRLVVSDVTSEALAPIFLDNPKGLLVTRGELNSFFQSFDAYRHGGKGGDREKWLEIFDAGEITVDRKTGDPKTIFVPIAGASIAGTIQPAILAAAFSSEAFSSGLAARFLLAHPPATIRRWGDRTLIPQPLSDDYEQIFRKLKETPKATPFEDETFHALTPEAEEQWAEFHDANHIHYLEADSDALRSLASKAETYAARLALILHLLRWANDEQIDPLKIDSESMRRAVRLVVWFRNETERVYSILAGDAAEGIDQSIIRWIAAKGGQVTARDLQQGPRRFRRSAEAAEEALQGLVNARIGSWEDTSGNGRPTRLFRLNPNPVTATQVRKTQELPTSVAVATSEFSENHSEGGRMEV